MSANEAFLCSEELSRIPACAKVRSTALSISRWMRGSVSYKSSLEFTNLLTVLILIISLTVHELVSMNLTVTTLMGVSVGHDPDGRCCYATFPDIMEYALFRRIVV